MFNNYIEAQNELENCWLNPAFTQIVLDDVDVNQVLTHYTTNKPISFTRTMLWDMEKKKAWNPADYIPYVVRKGSARSWGKQPCNMTDCEIFVRSSQQKQWLHPDIYEEVYEEVYVNNKDQIVTFLGVKILPGRSDVLTPRQPLFHIQHAVGGTEARPLNKWRIVHLTKEKDTQLITHFKKFNDPTTLPGFIKVYIEKDLHVTIEHK